MEQDDFIGIRVPHELRRALERERQQMSKAAGAEVKTSAVLRALLEQVLRERQAGRRQQRNARA